MSVFLAIDLGTTGCRSILFDENLNLLASDYKEYGLITPKEKWAEQNAELWWELTLSTTANAIKKAGISGKAIDSISISSQGITIVPVDENATPLCNAISWLDTRAGAEALQISEDFGEEKIFALTGKPISAVYTLPKLLWLKNNCPKIYDKAFKFLMPMDYLIAKFTGRFTTDCSMASGTLMYDLDNFCWCDEILNRYGIGKQKLPEVVFGGEKAGYVLPQVAEILGLRTDCVVAVGAQDQKCAAYGAGLSDGVITISLGTAAAITKYCKIADVKEDDRIGRCGYLDSSSFVSEGVINTAGTCLRWARDLFFKDEKYDVIDAEAKEALERDSSLLFYPYLAGADLPNFYPDSQGVFYGMTLSAQRGDFALAVMEGIAFQIRGILEAMQVYDNSNSLVLFGGGAKSDLWATIISNITGMKIKVPKTFEAAGAGAAMLAAKAVGKQLLPLETRNTYLPEDSEIYNNKYLKYRTVENKMWG